MITCNEIIRFMEAFAPPELAEEWDNIGLLVGSEKAEVAKIMLCMDITSTTVEEAIERKADLIITHHPVIFKGIKRMTEDEEKGKLLSELIRNRISVFTAHTNLDFAESGVNARLAEAIGLQGLQTLGNGPGKAGNLKIEASLEEFTAIVKQALCIPYIRLVGSVDHNIKRAAIFSGSYEADLEAFRKSGADVLVTGDLKYHDALDAAEAGLCIMDAGHFNTEKVVLPGIMDALKGAYPELGIFCSEKEADPFKTC